MNREDLDVIEAAVGRLRASLPPPPTPRRLVKAGESLQAALDQGGAIDLEAGATFEGQAFFAAPGTDLFGHGATLIGQRGPGLGFKPGGRGFSATDLTVRSLLWTASPVQLGAADHTQARLEDVPADILLTGVRVPSHRGKRGFGLHSTRTVLQDCEGLDIWITGADSQPWWIHNTPGDIKILGGRWNAGAELGLLGGADRIIPVCPSNVEIAYGEYFRPPEWKTNDVDEEVKNGIEIKDGDRTYIHDLTIRGCWQDAQPLGAAFMLTPANGGQVTNTLIERIALEDCADGISITGHDAAGLNPTQTTGIVVRRLTGRLTKGTSRGFFLLAQRFVGTVDVADCAIDTDGTTFAVFVDATERFTLRGTTARVGKYGLTFGGFHASASADPTAYNVAELAIEGNALVGAGLTSRFKARFPSNTFLTEDEFQARMAEMIG